MTPHRCRRHTDADATPLLRVQLLTNRFPTHRAPPPAGRAPLGALLASAAAPSLFANMKKASATNSQFFCSHVRSSGFCGTFPFFLSSCSPVDSVFWPVKDSVNEALACCCGSNDECTTWGREIDTPLNVPSRPSPAPVPHGAVSAMALTEPSACSVKDIPAADPACRQHERGMDANAPESVRTEYIAEGDGDDESASRRLLNEAA